MTSGTANRSFKKRAALIALLMIIVGAAGAGAILRDDNTRYEATPVNMEKTFDSRLIDNLTIAADTSDITFVPTESENITIRVNTEYLKNGNPFVTLDAGTDASRTLRAQIRTREPFQIGLDIRLLIAVVRNPSILTPEVTVELPQKAFQSVRVESLTGDIKLPSMTSVTANIDTETGDITVGAFQGDRLQAETSTGDMRMENVQGEVMLESDTGDIELVMSSSLRHHVSVKTDTGDVVLTAAQPLSASQLDLQTDTGLVTVEAPVTVVQTRGKHQLVGSLAAEEIRDGTRPLIKVRSDTGDVTFKAR